MYTQWDHNEKVMSVFDKTVLITKPVVTRLNFGTQYTDPFILVWCFKPDGTNRY